MRLKSDTTLIILDNYNVFLKLNIIKTIRKCNSLFSHSDYFTIKIIFFSYI